MNDFLCKSVNIQAAGKDDHVNANQLNNMVGLFISILR